MSSAQSFKDLAVWQKAMALAEETYRLSQRLPERERFGIWSQLTRAAASVPANVAEGHGRQGPREFANFVSIARGSLAELETFLLLAQRLGYFAEEDIRVALSLSDEVGRLLTRLHQSLRSPTNAYRLSPSV
jgi:four helix bundle protein